MELLGMRKSNHEEYITISQAKQVRDRIGTCTRHCESIRLHSIKCDEVSNLTSKIPSSPSKRECQSLNTFTHRKANSMT